MAIDFLEDIYREAEVYTSIINLVRRYRNGQADRDFLVDINSYNDILTNICKKLATINEEAGNLLWEELVSLGLKKELVDCLDTIEGEILPRIYDYLNSIPKIDVQDDNILFKSSSVGFLYLSNAESNIQYDSRINPMYEAYEITSDFYDYSKYHYVFLGCGLGYIPYQFYKAADGDIKLTIVFHDNKEYEYARQYGVLDWIPENIVEIIISDDILDFMKKIADNCDDYYIYNMTYEQYPRTEVAVIENMRSSQITRLSSDKYNYINYCHNKRYVKQYFTELKDEKKYNKIVIVAGGPSVDDNIEFLRSCKERGIVIVAVGTVLKKLIGLNIRPDIVTVCDPYITTINQFEDIGDCEDIILVLGAATCQKVARNYNGPKYLAVVDNNPKEVKQDAYKMNTVIIPSCATVTSFSYSVAKELGAKEIYLVGADYGFPNGYSHAEGTSDRKKIEGTDYVRIKSVNGNMILASQNLIEYRDEIEELIKVNSEINTYNLSKTGALIKGTKNIRNWE